MKYLLKTNRKLILSLNRFLGSRAVSVLNHWFQSNRDYPYPDDERTDRLAREAGIKSFSL
jgi:hypothetical protein